MSTDSPSPSPSASPSPTAARRVMAVLAAGGIVTTLVQTAVVPLLPQLPRLTGAAPVDVGWVVTLTLLTGAVATPLLGRAGDMYGKRRMLLVALGALAVGSLVCSFASTLPWLLVSRGLQGWGPRWCRCRSASCGPCCRRIGRVRRLR